MLAKHIIHNHGDESKYVEFHLHHKNAFSVPGKYDIITYDPQDRFFTFEYLEEGAVIIIIEYDNIREMCMKIMHTRFISVKNKITYNGISLAFFDHFGML